MTGTLRGERVLLRPWTDADLAPFAALNADPVVMRHFPKPLTRTESDALAERIRERLRTHGHGLWALQVPGIGFAGFVGVMPVPFEWPVDAALDGIASEPHEIGWRLVRVAWGHGYASEAARLALRHAHHVLGWPQVVSFTATSNRPSEAVMRRLGMTRRGEFDHPKLAVGHPLRRHVVYAHDADEVDETDAACLAVAPRPDPSPLETTSP